MKPISFPCQAAVPACVCARYARLARRAGLLSGCGGLARGARAGRVLAGLVLGWAAATGWGQVDHFVFSNVPNPQNTDTPFNVTITAVGTNGVTATSFAGTVTLSAAGLEGPLPLATPAAGPFVNGQWSGTEQVTAVGTLVCLQVSQPAPGTSNPFHVEPPVLRVLPQPLADIGWSTANGVLYGIVPATAGVYSNQLVAIDPVAGQVTNAWPLAANPGTLELSPDAPFLYVAVSNRFALQRVNLAPVSVERPFGTADWIISHAVLGDTADSVVASLSDTSGNYQGVWRYDSGAPSSLYELSALGPFWMETCPGAPIIYGCCPLFSAAPLPPGPGVPGIQFVTLTNASLSGGRILYRNGAIYDTSGEAVAASTLALLGTYPGAMGQLGSSVLMDVDPDLRRAFYLSCYHNYGSSTINIRAYDRDSFVPLGQLQLPYTPGVPERFLRWSTNGLVLNLDNGQVWFVQSGVLQPSRPPVDLSLTQTMAPLPAVVGSNLAVTLTLSNAGPGLATFINVSNHVPANVTAFGASVSTGSVAVGSGAVEWTLTELSAGASATCQFTLVPGAGGWVTNAAWAIPYETDVNFTNNLTAQPFYVGLSLQGFGVVQVGYPTQDLLYDPVRDRLLLSVANGSLPGQSNGVAVFNPYTGLTEAFAPMGLAPSRMARSDDGQLLYVSVPDAGLVRQLNLPTLTTNYTFAVGGEAYSGVGYTNYAASLAVVPRQPNSVVAWTVRHPYAGSLAFGEGIALYQGGVMASNVTATGGSWEVLFDTSAGTLFGYNNGALYECNLSTNGVSLAQEYPTISGADVESGGGHLFTSYGEMVDYNPFRMDWLFTGAQGAALVAPDAATSRVFYLVPSNGWQLNAYDVPSRCLLGSLTISNVLGTPSRLIRWGTDGLAFQTTSNQLFLMRSPLVRTDAFASVALALAGPTGPVALGSNATFTVSVTNQGTTQASNVWITNTWSAGVALLSVSPGAGSTVTNTNANWVAWSLPTLDPGAQTTLTCRVQTVQTGLVTMLSWATTPTFDLGSSNRTAVATLLVGAPLGLDGCLSFQVSANDVVWSPTLARFLLTAGGNVPNWAGGLLSADPASLALQYQATLGANGSRLARARDDALLYAAVDYGVAALTIPSLTVTDRFLVNQSNPGYYAYDMQVEPGNDAVVAIASKTSANNLTFVGAYAGGAELTNVDSFYSAALSLQFGDQPSPLYAYVGPAFNRYTLDATGVTVMDSTTGLLPYNTALDLVWGNGTLYSSLGGAINPSTIASLGTLPGVPSGSRVVYDAVSGWIFYLSPGSRQAVLRAYDGVTLLPAGSRTISGVNGSLNRFIRWGVDGFAALTSSNQLVFFRSSLIPTNPPADVSVALTQSAPPYVQGNSLTATLVVSNAGPNAATSVVWTNLISGGAAILSATASSGSVATNAGCVTGVIPLLGAGTSATVTVVFVVPGSGIVTNQLSATSSSVDPNFANNSAVGLLWVQPASGPANFTTLALPVSDLEADPTRPLLYASFGSGAGQLANMVVTIDPVNQAIGPLVPAGSNPGRLAASPDGQFLYVALNGASAVEQLSLPSLANMGAFALPAGQSVVRMMVCPTNSGMVAVRLSAGETVLYVGGVPRPNELSAQDLFAFVDTSGQLFGCAGASSDVKLYAVDTGPGGLALLAGQPGKQSSSTDLRASGGLLFYNGGMVVNPATTRGLDLMPVPYNSSVAPDAGCGRAFYLTPVSGGWALRAFDIAQGVEVGAAALPSLAGTPQKLLRWGANGLAFYTTGSQVSILQTPLVPADPPTDLAVTQTVSPLTASTNTTLTFSLVLTNLGPSAASGVVVTQNFSSALTYATLAATPGGATYTNGSAVWQVGNLPTGAVATLTVSGRATQPGTLTATASAYHGENDPFWGNNVAIGTVNVLSNNTSSPLLIQLPARQLVYDGARDVIYASTPASNRLGGNLIAVIDPAAGALKACFAAGSEPDQLALSDDSRYLQVGLDGAMGVGCLDLASNVGYTFALTTNDICWAQSLAVQPGHPQTVAASLGSYNFASGYPSTVVAYDSGVTRMATGGPAQGLTFSADGSTLFGCVAPGTSWSFERMTLGPQGFTTVSVPGFTTVPGNLRFSNGRLYSGSGQVVDPNTGALLGSMGLSGPLAIDGPGGRAFYLAQSGSTWQIQAYNLATLQPAGTQAVLKVSGTPASLIRCGQDRLAFLTSASQVFILHSPLVATNPLPPADLALSQVVTQDFTVPAPTLRFLLTATNCGPGAATNLLLSIVPPSAVASISVQVPQGTATNSGGHYLCNLGALPAGQSLSVLLSAILTNTGWYTNYASLSAATPDPNLSNNTAVASLQGQVFQPPNSARTFASPARALAYDPLRQRLFAATTNLLIWYDPESGAQMGTVPVGLTPDFLRVTDDGQYLYLAANSTGLVQRLPLATLSVDLSWTPIPATRVSAIAIIPGNPHSVALTAWTNSTPVTAIYDDAVVRTNVLAENPFGVLAASSGTILYGLSQNGTGALPYVFRMGISASGLQDIDSGPWETPFTRTSMMKYAFNVLLFGSGDVLATSPWSLEQPFSIPNQYYEGGIEPLPASGLVAFAINDIYTQGLFHFGIFVFATRHELEQFDLWTPVVRDGNLTWCGADRFAFLTSSGLTILRASSVPAADLSVTAAFTTNQVMAGDTACLQIGVSNAGPYAVTNVWLTNTLPAGFSLVSATVPQGSTVLTNGQTLLCQVGAMATNTSATLRLGLSLDAALVDLTTNLVWVADTVTVGALDVPDPIPFNNTASAPLTIAPRDSNHDGIPDYWCLEYGFDPNDPKVASESSAGDGVSNLQKYLAGTSPFVFEGICISGWNLAAPCGLDLTVHGAVGLTYALQASPDLVQWSTLSNFLCQSTNQQVCAPAAAGPPGAFYRIATTTNLPIPVLSVVNGPPFGTNPPVVQVAAPPGFSYSVYASSDQTNWVVFTNFYATIWNTCVTDWSANGTWPRFYHATRP